MFKLIISFILLQIIVINSKSLNNNKTIDNNNSEISPRNNTKTPPSPANNAREDYHNNYKSDMLAFKKYKFVNKINSFKNNHKYNNLTKLNEKHLLNANEGRGKTKKIKKKLKMLTPMLLMVLAAKSIFLPFLLKGFTIVSASSFILSKISLVVSMLVLFRLLYAQSSGSKVEIYSAPIKIHRNGWNNRQGIEYGDDSTNNNWDDMSYTNSNYSSAFPYNQQ